VNEYDELIEELTAEYERRRARTGELHRQLREVSGTATAPRGVVKISVGAQGEVRDIQFPTGAYKRMAPAELSAALLATIGEATNKAVEKVTELMEPELPGSEHLIGLFTGKTELPQALPDEPPMPNVVREYLEPGRPAGGNNV
jgi:DNA-binding protein YbaB